MQTIIQQNISFQQKFKQLRPFGLWKHHPNQWQNGCKHFFGDLITIDLLYGTKLETILDFRNLKFDLDFCFSFHTNEFQWLIDLKVLCSSRQTFSITWLILSMLYIFVMLKTEICLLYVPDYSHLLFNAFCDLFCLDMISQL